MYQSNAFRNFIENTAKTYGSHYRAYAEEFTNYDDEELAEKLYHYTGQMTLHTFGTEGFNEYFDEVQRMVECMNLRQQFLAELEADELV